MSLRLASTQGSILMEFLLVLPIYFVLIGGTFSIGELLLNRHRLLESDRIAAWMYGQRHDRDSNSLAFLNLFVYDIATQDPGNAAVATYSTQYRATRHWYAWAQTVGSKVSADVPQPEWTRGWLHGSTDSWNESFGEVSLASGRASAVMDQLRGLNLFSRKSTYNFLHVSLMRSKIGEMMYRNPGNSRHGSHLCHEGVGWPVSGSVWYEKVYDESFPYHSLGDLANKFETRNEDTGSDSNNQRDYARFPSYQLWSQ